MIARCILKVIGVLTLVSISIVALTVILLVGWFLLTMIFPNRMNVTGRVTDSAGRPIKAAQVHAVPLPIICHLSTVICRLASIVFRLSTAICPLSSIVCRLSSDRHMDLITLEDVVLEEEKPNIISPKAPGFMPGVRNYIPYRKPRHLWPGMIFCLASKFIWGSPSQKQRNKT
jgi:hypothetical protein